MCVGVREGREGARRKGRTESGMLQRVRTCVVWCRAGMPSVSFVVAIAGVIVTPDPHHHVSIHPSIPVHNYTCVWQRKANLPLLLSTLPLLLLLLCSPPLPPAAASLPPLLLLHPASGAASTWAATAQHHHQHHLLLLLGASRPLPPLYSQQHPCRSTTPHQHTKQLAPSTPPSTPSTPAAPQRAFNKLILLLLHKCVSKVCCPLVLCSTPKPPLSPVDRTHLGRCLNV